MIPNRISRGFVALNAAALLITALSVGACAKKEPAPEPATVQDPTSAGPETAAETPKTDDATATPEAAGAGDEATACADFTAKICEKAGQDNDVCTALKTVSVILPPKACVAALADVDYAVSKLGDVRKPCNELVAKLCADLGEETKTCAMVKERTGQFPVAQCQSMMGNYDKVIAELRAMEAKNQPLKPELVAKQEGTDAASFGPADAKVTLVEYSDFQCPYCSRAAETLHALKARYGNVVRFVFRQFPLSFHEHAMPAAKLSLLAKDKGKFWELHDLMFKNQKDLSDANLIKFAGEVGIDEAAAKAALTDASLEEKIKGDMKLGEEVGVSGTPSMFLGAERIENPMDVDGISAKIDAALTAAGVPVPPKPADAAPTQP